MRELDLYPEPQRGTFVESLTSGLTVSTLSGFQNDTLKLRIHGGTRKRPAASQSLNPYIEQAWSFASMRASISLIDPVTKSTDVAPERGRFKLRVGDQTTDWLTWPQPAGDALTSAEIAAFKAAVLTALNALSTVTAGMQAADPADAPVHTLYFAWIDPEVTTPIEVAELQLIPPVDDEVGAQQSSPYVQYVKLTQLPIVITDDFAFPSAPEAVVSSERTGGAGVNAQQLLTIPDDGAFDLTYSAGVTTAVLSCASLTAATLASALNALAITGITDTNPGFAVTARGTKTFAIEFIGPLAETAQSNLTPTMRQSASSLVAVAEMALTSKRFERALNGAQEATLRFELAIDAKEATWQADFTLKNDATGPGTVENAASQLAIVTNTNTEYITVGETTAIATVSPGASVEMGGIAVATTYSIEHGLGTPHVFVRVSHRDSDDPEEWKDLQRGSEFDWHSTSDDFISLTFGDALVADDTDSFWFREKFQVFIYSPDSQVELLQHTHPISDVLLLQEQLDAIRASLGMLGGDLKINISQLVGLLTAEQIDMSSFLTSMFETLAGDTALNSTFTSLLVNSLVSNAEFLKELAAAIKDNADWIDALRALILSVIGSSGGTIGSTTSLIPDVEFIYPRRHFIATAPGKVLIPNATVEEVSSGVTTTYVTTIERDGVRSIVDYGPLSPALGNLTAGADLTEALTLDADVTVTVGTFTVTSSGGEAYQILHFGSAHGLAVNDRVKATTTASDLPAGLTEGASIYVKTVESSTAITVSATQGGSAIDITDAGTGTHTLSHYIADSGRKFKVASGATVKLPAIDGLAESIVPANSYVAYSAGHWYVVELVSTTNYPTAYKKTFFSISKTAVELTAGQRWNVIGKIAYQLQSLDGDEEARVRFIVERAPFNAAGAAPTLDSLTWSEVLSQVAIADAAPKILPLTFRLEHLTEAIGTVTIDVSSNLLTVSTDHDLAEDDLVFLTVANGTAYAGFTEGDYLHVIASGLTSDDLKVSATEGGAALDFTGTATGTHTLWRVTYQVTATLGAQSTSFTLASLDTFLRCRCDRFDPAEREDGLDSAGSFVARFYDGSHSTVSAS